MQFLGRFPGAALVPGFHSAAQPSFMLSLFPSARAVHLNFDAFMSENYSNKNTKAARNLQTLSHKCLGLSFFLCCEMREQTQG